MAVTPYPFGVDHFENPSIFKSQDGISWEAGGHNPIVYPTQRKKAHLSDPDMIWDEKAKQLRLFYRETQYKKESVFNFIFTTSTLDGLYWTSPVLILKSSEDGCLSPSAVTDGEKIEVFYVSTLNNSYQLRKKTLLYSCDVGEDVICRINNIPLNKFLWHIDIIRNWEQYIGVFVFASASGGSESSIYWGSSMDCGITWDIGHEIIVDKLQQDKLFKNLYRSCLVPTEENPSTFDLYFSAQLCDNSWHIFYLPRLTAE